MNFEYLLTNLKDGICEPLYGYNQYILKRFFEYALDNKDYVKSVLNGRTGLYKQIKYCPKHEKVIITACITSLNRNPRVLLYKQYYNDYLTLKTSFMGWRGRSDWFDFHKTILSHFIWINDIDTFSWTSAKITEYMKGFKKKYPTISDWRRRWYLQEVRKLRLYIIYVCGTSNRIQFLEKLFKNNVLKITKSIENSLIQYGYECKKDDMKISKAKFTYTDEWKWLTGQDISVNNINVQECFDICIQSNFCKNKLISLFLSKEPTAFWNFFANMQYSELDFINCKNICSILKNERFNILDDIELKRSVIKNIFELRWKITTSLQKLLSKRLDGYKLKLTEGASLVIGIILNDGSEQTNTDFSYMKSICELFIDLDSKETIKNNTLISYINDFSTDQLYWLYTLLGDSIGYIINMVILNKKNSIETTDVCPICLLKLCDHTNCTFPCGHSFHNSCISKDINSGRHTHNTYTCPMCRSKININWFNNHILQ